MIGAWCAALLLFGGLLASCSRSKSLESFGGPEKLGVHCAHLLFEDWPERFAAYKGKMPRRLSDYPRDFAIEFLALRLFTLTAPAAQRNSTSAKGRNGEIFYAALLRETAALLKGYGWPEEDLNAWLRIVGPRYQEYIVFIAEIKEAPKNEKLEVSDKRWAAWGRAFARHVHPQIDLTEEEAGSIGFSMTASILQNHEILDDLIGPG